MTFQQLRAFCKVAECESVTKAADDLFVTQPALSMMLKKTETELGVSLFDRRGRYIQLNDDGRAVYRCASNLLMEWDALMEELHKPKTDSQLLRFCFEKDYIQNYVLPVFIANNPKIRISMNEVDGKAIHMSLCSEVCDIAISGLHWNPKSATEIDSIFFYTNRLMVSVPDGNSLSTRQSVQLKDLKHEKFIRLNKEGEFTSEVDTEAAQEHITLTVVQRVNYEIMKILQHNFDFFYFITSLQTEFDFIPSNRRLIPVEGPAFTRDLYLSYLKKNEEKVRPFLEWADNRWGLKDIDSVGSKE